MIEEITRLMTEYGVIQKNGDLERLDRDAFLKWVSENRRRIPKEDELREEDWVLLYKVSLARSYATRYHNLSEKL